MKKYMLILASVFMVQFAGCNNKKEPGANTGKPTAPVLAVANTDPGKSQAKKHIILLSKKDFLEKVWNYEESPKEWVYKGDKPALIDFYADWCGPCRMMAPIMDELAKEYEGKLYVYKIDTDVEKELAAVFGIQSLPSFLIIPMKEQPQMMAGARSKDMFKEIVDTYLVKK